MADIDRLRLLLRRLDGEPADALESEELEFKAWEPDPSSVKGRLRALRETVVCLANRKGGSIVLGVADRKRSRHEAIHGVGDLDAERLRHEIYRGTEPSILVDIVELREPEGRLVVVRVPRGLPPHTTTEGVGKVRVGKECRPLTGSDLTRLLVERRGTDLTAEVVDGATANELDASEIDRLRRHLEEGEKADLAKQTDSEILDALGLVRDGDVTMAGLLLLGRERDLGRLVPSHDVVFLVHRTATAYDDRRDLRGPPLKVLAELRELLARHLTVQPVLGESFVETTVPDLTWSAAREAVLNAIVHRDYFQGGSVQIGLFRDRVEVSSPGGFLGGVTPANVLRHPPVRRNPLLAEVFQAIGLVNRAGLGVDRLYEELLRLGKAPPRYEADVSSVRLTLPTRTNRRFAAFVADERRAGRGPDLDDLILLRAAVDHGVLDRWSAARALQLPEEDAASRLIGLREAGILRVEGRGRGTKYRLARELSDRLRGRSSTDHDLPLDEERLRLRIESVLAERGELSNADLRRLTGESRQGVIRIMNRLREQGLADLRGRGRAARWVPGPKVAKRRRR